MQYKHVQHRGGRFVWRLNLFNSVLKNLNSKDFEITYSHPALAAYDCDLVKYYLREKFNFRTTKTEPSFPEETFRLRAEKSNLDLSNLSAVFSSLSEAAQGFIGYYAEAFEAHAARVAAAPAPSTDYLATLLASVSKRHTEAIRAVHKARQLTSLNDRQRAALCDIETKLEALELATRESCASILSLV